MQIDIEKIKTPAMIFNLDKLRQDAERIRSACQNVGAYFLYSVKACAVKQVLEVLSEYVDGFSVSSEFEAQWARKIANNTKTIHWTSPFLDNPVKLLQFVDYVSCNSMNQFSKLKAASTIGLRINPQFSITENAKYDPCRHNSKLGVPLSTLLQEPELIKRFDGIHFHTTCEQDTFEPLLLTVEHLCKYIGKFLGDLKWVNLGGGYMFFDEDNWQCLKQTIAIIKKHAKTALIFLEPGTAAVSDCCDIVTEVHDILISDEGNVVILDTSVNHLPEVLEFNYTPQIESSCPNGKYKYVLAGSTCLAGDLFGSYRFNSPLIVGDKLTINYCGSYSIVKADMFNGINLPNIYSFSSKQGLEFVKSFCYSDYVSRLA